VKSPYLILVLIPTLLLGGCTSFLATPTVTPTWTPLPSATSTASPTPTEMPTFTPQPTATPTVIPTIVPIDGILLANTNVRRQPSSGGDPLGGYFYQQKVKVIGRNDNATWLWIIYKDGPGGTGWILGKAVQLQGDIGRLPIVIVSGSDPTQVFPPLIFEITGTPLPVNTPGPGARTITIVQLSNVRVGPGIGYLSLGWLQPGTLLSVTGRIQKNAWLQIEYPSGPDGRAWVSRDLVKINDDLGGLPFYNILGTPEGAESGAPPADTSGGEATPVPPPSDNSGGIATDTLPAPATTASGGPVGSVTTQINVRTGPASSFPSLGLLNPDAQVTLTGRTINGLWFQIEYPGGPNGRAWVASSYIDVTGDIEQLPYFDDAGNPVTRP
jgi:uncharacterized protein YraI